MLSRALLTNRNALIQKIAEIIQNKVSKGYNSKITLAKF